MIQEVESKINAATGGKVKAQVRMSPEMQIDVECSFSPPTKGNCLLFLHRGGYETMGVPENIKHLWRPPSLVRLARDKDNLCQVASHRMKNHRGEENYTQPGHDNVCHPGVLPGQNVSDWASCFLGSTSFTYSSDQKSDNSEP